MKIFLTGATGFVGGYIGRAVVEAGLPLVCLKRKTSDLSRCAAFSGKATWLDRDSDWMGAVIAQQPQALIHAAWTGVAAAKRDDEKAQADNSRFFSELLEVTRAAGVQRFIGLGSAAEYGQINGRVDENYPCNPTNAYGRAKLACLRMLEDFANRHAVSYAWLRLFSTYGPGEGEQWFIPGVLRQMRAGQAPRLTACEQRYDYLHARDVAAGVLAAARKTDASGVFNLGSNASVPLKQIVRMLQKFCGSAVEPEFGALPYRPNQSMRMEGDSWRFYATFGFAPRITLEQGLRELAAKA
jgi:nucleoside-diphosphate-sugar epimerase